MKKLISPLGIATILLLGSGFSTHNSTRLVAQDTKEIEALVRICNWSNGEQALDACEQLLEIDPGYNKARIEKGLTLIWLERYPEAQAYFNQILGQEIDLILLARSFNKFFNSKMYQTKSELEIISNKTDPNSPENLSTYLQINTIAKRPNQFWSEISLVSLDADYQPKITIVSDGEKVWKIDHNANQYLSTDFSSFSEELDALLLFSSQIYLLFWQGFYADSEITEDLDQAELEKFIEVGITNMILEMLFSNPSALIGRLEAEHYIYEYKEAEKGLQFKVFIDPETATVKQINLSAQEESLTMVIKEDIQSRVADPVIKNNQFTFTPSHKFKKVDSISVWDSFIEF